MRALIALVSLAILAGGATANTPEARGRAIVAEMHDRDSGWRDMSATMKMILSDRQGNVSTRKVRYRALEVIGDGDKSLSIFDAPADVRGTVFLSHTHALEADDQWLFLPALKRVKRISSANKSGPFMGSEFAYEDIASQEIDKYDYRLVREESLDDRPAYLIEQFPRYERSGYTRELIWIDRQRYVPLRLDYYDRKGDLLKTLKFHKYERYLDRYWRSGEMVMENHQTGKLSTLVWSDYRFGQRLDDRDFDRSVLKRIR
ncbi:MAG: outer membrane lipoprotein-sorting protein [Proteobacteria bacterium]|nr:MAG: outer membrane lipoprotein-sorting protein [Pseudomonadota bacterium]